LEIGERTVVRVALKQLRFTEQTLRNGVYQSDRLAAKRKYPESSGHAASAARSALKDVQTAIRLLEELAKDEAAPAVAATGARA